MSFALYSEDRVHRYFQTPKFNLPRFVELREQEKVAERQMEQSSNVPKFGNWESQQDVPYTVYFEKARKHRSGEKLKPSDTQGNPNMPYAYTPPVQALLSKEVKTKASKDLEPTGSKHKQHTGREDGKMWRSDDSSLHHDTVGQKEAVVLPHQRHGGARSGSGKPELEETRGPVASRLKYELHLSREDGELRRPTDSPSRHETVGHRAAADLNYQRNGGVNSGDKRSMRQSTGSDHSIDHSPLHPRYQAMVGGKSSGVSSPSWQKRLSSEVSHGLGPSTQRSQLRPSTQGNRKPDDSTAVPKFGDWDERNPSSAEGYTHIFNKVHEEKQRCCCFPWGRK
ncbi:hypothetical protein AAG906_016597 [Vitis piasezkii]